MTDPFDEPDDDEIERDAVNPDRVQDDFYRGLSFIESVAAERRRNQPPPQEPEYPEGEQP